MPDALLTWLWGFIATTGLLAGGGFLLRNVLLGFFSKAVEHRFETKLEAFKAEIRDRERELDQIRAFLVTARKDRDMVIQSKRLEAAEALLRKHNLLSQMAVLVEYMKILDVEKLLLRGDDPKVANFIAGLIKPLNVEEKLEQFKTSGEKTYQLYLDQRTLDTFKAYEAIVLHAVMVSKLLSMPLHDKGKAINSGNLSKVVVELLPSSKKGFEQFGDSFAYHWSTFFHAEVLRLLRAEVAGADDNSRDTASAIQLALNSRRAQLTVLSSLKLAGLSEDLIRRDEPDMAHAAEAETGKAQHK